MFSETPTATETARTCIDRKVEHRPFEQHENTRTAAARPQPLKNETLNPSPSRHCILQDISGGVGFQCLGFRVTEPGLKVQGLGLRIRLDRISTEATMMRIGFWSYSLYMLLQGIMMWSFVSFALATGGDSDGSSGSVQKQLKRYVVGS